METFLTTFFIVLGVYLVGCLVLGFIKFYTKRKNEKDKNKNDNTQDDNK